MPITPGQISELRSIRNVRGTIEGGLGIEKTLYAVTVDYAVLARAQELASLGALPPGLVWYLSSGDPNRATLHANKPEWFVELEEMINDARRPTNPYR